jgi:hypothetical protein
VGGLPHQIARWVFQGRIRLGDGLALEPIRAEEVEEARRRFPRPKFFIFGHARSGTSLLARLVRLHPNVHCEWQTQFFSERGPIPYFTSPSFHRWLRHPSNKWTSDWDPTAALLRTCCDTILEREADRVKKGTVGDKSPNGNGAQAVRWLAAVYPDAQLIYILRDGRDTVLSQRIQAFIDQPQNLNLADRWVRRSFLRDPRPFYEKRKSVFTRVWLERAAGRWAKGVEESVAAGQELFGRRFAVVRYEDLLEDPSSELKKLWMVLEVETGATGLETEIARELARNPEAEWHASFGFDYVAKLPRGLPGGWQSLFTPDDRERFEQTAGKALDVWGYRWPT